MGWVGCLGMGGVQEYQKRKENKRAENEYCKHCFNLKQRCFQENEFQWSWAKNNYRAFLVLFCEWRASLLWQCRARRKQSPEIEVMPLCPCTSTPPLWQTFLSFSFPIASGMGLCKREASGSSSQTLAGLSFLMIMIICSDKAEVLKWKQDWGGVAGNTYFRF